MFGKAALKHENFYVLQFRIISTRIYFFVKIKNLIATFYLFNNKIFDINKFILQYFCEYLKTSLT